MRKILAVLVLMVVGFGSVFAYEFAGKGSDGASVYYCKVLDEWYEYSVYVWKPNQEKQFIRDFIKSGRMVENTLLAPDVKKMMKDKNLGVSVTRCYGFDIINYYFPSLDTFVTEATRGSK